MLAEFLKAIVGLADERNSFKTHESPDGKVQYLAGPGGKVIELTKPRYRNYEAHDLGSFMAILQKLAGDGVSPIVMVDHRDEHLQAKCFFDESDRRESMTLTVFHSVMFNKFKYLTTWSKQRDVVNALRDELFGSAEAGLLATLRSIDFTRKNDGTRTIQHGSESLGRSVEMKVQAKSGEIPERTAFTIQWFSARDFSNYVARIECSVDTDATQEAIRFVPSGDSFDVAAEHAALYVADIIREEVDRLGIACTVVNGASRS
jgi:hypothetical protein